MSKFLCICLSATIQKTVNFKNVQLEKVNRSLNYILDASGKAVNSARVLNQIEAGCVSVVCPLGKENSAEFLKLAEKDNLNVFAVETIGRVRECITLLDVENGTTTELVVGEPVTADSYQENEEKLISVVESLIKDVDGVLFAGSRPGIWSDGFIPCIAFMAEKNGKIFMADYCGEDLLHTMKITIPSIIKINEEEFCSTFDYSEEISEENLKSAIIKKSQQLKNIIVVTRGKKSTFAADNGIFYDFPTEKIIPVNTTACGDSFSAGFLYEYVNSHDMSEALARGTWCAARNAELMRAGSIES